MLQAAGSMNNKYSESFYSKYEPDLRQYMGTICCSEYQICNVWGRYAVQSIRSVVCALRFLTQNQYQGCRMPAGTCMHRPADWAPPGPAGAPEPCLTCWHLKPALASASIEFSLPIKLCKDVFLKVLHLRACKDTG